MCDMFNSLDLVHFCSYDIVHTLPLCIRRHRGVSERMRHTKKIASAVSIYNIYNEYIFLPRQHFFRGIKSLVVTTIISSLWTRI